MSSVDIGNPEHLVQGLLPVLIRNGSEESGKLTLEMWERPFHFVIACIAAAIRALWDAISDHLELAYATQFGSMETVAIIESLFTVRTWLQADW